MYEILTNMYEAIKTVVEGTEFEMLSDEYFRELAKYAVNDMHETVEFMKEGE